MMASSGRRRDSEKTVKYPVTFVLTLRKEFRGKVKRTRQQSQDRIAAYV
jgi:hypothetical protein